MGSFQKLFSRKPIIGMLHLFGFTGENRVTLAIDELAILEDADFDGVIVENYHGILRDVERVLDSIAARSTKLSIGVNVLPNEFAKSFELSARYGAQFIQLDHVAGAYTRGTIDSTLYVAARTLHPEIVVLGGVWPKYYEPLRGSILADDIRNGMERADALVVTGAGTGVETPLEKILSFRNVIDVIGTTDFPVILGAGATPDNAQRLLKHCDGVIVGSALKPYSNTNEQISPELAYHCSTAFRQAWE